MPLSSKLSHCPLSRAIVKYPMLFRTNIGVDTVKCLCCQRVMVATIDQSLTPAFRANVVSQLRAQLVSSAHAPLCPWRDTPVPLALLQLSGSSATEVLRDAQARLSTLRRCVRLPVLAPEFLRSPPYRRVLDAVAWPAGKRCSKPFPHLGHLFIIIETFLAPPSPATVPRLPAPLAPFHKSLRHMNVNSTALSCNVDEYCSSVP